MTTDTPAVDEFAALREFVDGPDPKLNALIVVDLRRLLARYDALHALAKDVTEYCNDPKLVVQARAALASSSAREEKE